MEYEAVCISGGSTKLVTACGLLYEYHQRGLLNGIKTWSGCSAGAFVIALYLCGKNPLKIIDYYPKIENINLSFDNINTAISTFVEKAGLRRIQQYTKRVRKAINKFVTGDALHDPTLAEFYNKTGVTFYIEAINVDDAEVVYFNHRDHPDVLLIDCLHATASIPFVFINVKINGKRYTDGGLYTSLPLTPLEGLKTLAFGFKSKIKAEPTIFDNVISFLRLPSSLVKKQDLKRHATTVSYIEVESNFDLFDFEKTHEQLLHEFAFGREQFHE